MTKVIKKHTIKKEQTEEDLKDTVADIRERLRQKQRIMIYSAVAFVVLLLCIVVLFAHTRSASNKALELEAAGYSFYYGDYNAEIMPAERLKKALEKFKASYEIRKRHRVLLYIANCYYELGDYDAAIKALKELTDRFSDIAIVSLAKYRMAMAYIQKGDADSALNILLELTRINNAPLRDLALMESGLILESLGKTEDAQGKYRELIERFPESAFLNEAKIRLGIN
jgi:predicted negative regulator of RcsB-dependent stress response